MKSWFLVLTATAIVLVLLCRINLYIDLHFCRRDQDDFLAITVHALQKLFIYSIKIPTIMFLEYGNLPWITTKLTTPHEVIKTKVDREQRFVKKTIKLLFYNPKRFLRLFRLGRYIFRNYLDYMDKLCQGIHCEKFELRTKYGFGDAAFTGIFMGVMGSITQIMLTSIHNRIALDTKPSISIQPNYNHSLFVLEVSCIFRIRLGNVITATIGLLRNLLHKEATRSG